MSLPPVDWSKEKGYKTIFLQDGTEVAEIMEYNGRMIPTFENNFIGRIDEIKEKFTSKEGDILIYGYMKSGKCNNVSCFKLFQDGIERRVKTIARCNHISTKFPGTV